MTIPGSFVWLGLRDRQLFGYRRAAWTQALTDPPARYLVLSGPHAFHPTELLPALLAGRVPGLHQIASLDEATNHADIFDVDATAIDLSPDAVPTHLSSDAADAWLDLAAPLLGEDGAAARLVAIRPVVSGDSLPALLARLGICAGPPGSETTVTLRPEDVCVG